MKRIKIRNTVTFISTPIAQGGEADIHNHPADPDGLLLKLHHQPERHSEKVRWQCKNPPKGFDPRQPTCAWPIEPVFEPGDDGDVIGFVMPRFLDCVGAFEFSDRQNRLPGIHPDFPFRVARSLVQAISEFHEKDIMVGDLNLTNILIDRFGNVILVDVDSFQILTDDDHLFTCDVGRPELQPPEFQVVDTYRGLKRTQYTDSYGAAVIIFLLCFGIHPFNKRYTGQQDPPPTRRDLMRDGIWPWAEVDPDVQPPRGAPDFSRCPDPIKELFFQTFIDGHKDPTKRPRMEEWADALAPYDSLQLCPSPRVWAEQLKFLSGETYHTSTNQVRNFFRAWPAVAASRYWPIFVRLYLVPTCVWLFITVAAFTYNHFHDRDFRPPPSVDEPYYTPLPIRRAERQVSLPPPIPKPKQDPFYSETFADLRGLDAARIWHELGKD